MLRKVRFRIARRLASLPWVPAHVWFRSFVLAPLAVLIGLHRSALAIVHHFTAFVAAVCLVGIAYLLHRFELLEGLLNPWIAGIAVLTAAVGAAMVVADWVRDQAEAARRRTDPRQEVAARRFRLVCEQERFEPSVLHTGHDNDMYGIGVELLTQRILIWKHGHAWILPLHECEFKARGRELWIGFMRQRHPGAPPGMPRQFRIACAGAPRSARSWVRLLRRSSERELPPLREAA